VLCDVLPVRPRPEQSQCPRSARTGITTAEFQALNPLVLCENGLYAGSAVCTGNTIAFCNDVIVAAPGDTCTSIASGSGAVINVDGERIDVMFQVLTSCGHRRLIFDAQDAKRHSHLCATITAQAPTPRHARLFQAGCRCACRQRPAR
jgi:hypothetical protein